MPCYLKFTEARYEHEDSDPGQSAESPPRAFYPHTNDWRGGLLFLLRWVEIGRRFLNKKYPKPKGKIEYGRLKKKIDLIKLCADFYLLYTMKTIAEDRFQKGEAFLKSRAKLLEALREAFEETTQTLEKLFLAYFPLAVASELQNSEQIQASDRKIEKIAGDILEAMPEGEGKELLEFLEQNVSTCEKAVLFFGRAKSVFGKLKWESGFGGKKWAQIVDIAEMRLAGETDSAVFIDTAFNVEHHNGHIFDKADNIRCSIRSLKDVLNIKRDHSLGRMKKLTKQYASNYIDNLFMRGNKFGWWKEENGSK